MPSHDSWPDVTALHFTALPAGMQLGPYVLDHWVRDGGVASVYRGRDTRTGSSVAIKVLAARHLADPELTARFEREAALMSRLVGASHVVQVLAGGRLFDGRPYLVLDWLEGTDLADLLEEHRRMGEPIAIPRIVAIARDVALGLAAIHERRIVHRDLKPANVMLHIDGAGHPTARLVDFGFSADARPRAIDPSRMGADITAAGFVVGTQGYMAPEQRVGAPVAPQFDLFAFGVLLGDLLSLLPPGARPADARALVALIERERPVPQRLLELLQRCLDPDPRRRPVDATAIVDDLDDLLAAPSGSNRPPTMRSWARQRPAQAAGTIDLTAGEPTPKPVQPMPERLRTRGMPAEPPAPARRRRPSPRGRYGALLMFGLGLGIAVACAANRWFAAPVAGDGPLEAPIKAALPGSR